MQKSPRLIIEIDIAELTCRIAESLIELERPPGLTAHEALASIEADALIRLKNAATSAAFYFAEVAAEAGVPMAD
jgi:hypothetical protein